MFSTKILLIMLIFYMKFIHFIGIEQRTRYKLYYIIQYMIYIYYIININYTIVIFRIYLYNLCNY